MYLSLSPSLMPRISASSPHQQSLSAMCASDDSSRYWFRDLIDQSGRGAWPLVCGLGYIILKLQCLASDSSLLVHLLDFWVQQNCPSRIRRTKRWKSSLPQKSNCRHQAVGIQSRSPVPRTWLSYRLLCRLPMSDLATLLVRNSSEIISEINGPRSCKYQSNQS